MLSTQERQVLCFAAKGLTDKSIARMMGISPHSVQTYWERREGETERRLPPSRLRDLDLRGSSVNTTCPGRH